MGLDMYLNGSKYRKYHPEQTDEARKSLPKQEVYELGYWRKHPDLHGYIVQHFANGIDECQEIYLDKDNLLQIIAAIKADQLPHTTGFFFGESQNDAEQKAEAIQTFEEAIKWLETPDDTFYRDIIYRASW